MDLRMLDGCKGASMRLLFLLLILALGMTAMAAEPGAAASGLRLDGGFIQYQDWMLKLDASAWRNELDAMRRARIDLIVIQWLQNDHTDFIPVSAQAVDP